MHLPQDKPEPISIEQFLPILMASEVKLELIDGFVVPFANGTQAHHLVCERIVHHLRAAAKAGCRVCTSQIALRRTDVPTYVFPDASYTCEAIEPGAECIVAPRLIVEVLSPRSVERDRGDKLDTYRDVPSIMEYLIIDSRRIWACAFRRAGPTWTVSNYGPDDTIELVSLDDAPLKLVDLYTDTTAR